MSVKTILSAVVIIVAIVMMFKNLKIAAITGACALFGWIVNKISARVENVLPFMTSTTFNVLVVFLALVIFAAYIKKQLAKEKTDEAPSTIILLVEFYQESVEGLVSSTMGKNNMKFAPFIFTLFTFLILSNLLGLIGMDSPTANYSVTLALALITFVMSQFYGLKTSGLGGHIKGYFEPLALLSPLNIIGDLADPISLSFRLFGNILSGGLIMTLISAAFGTLSTVVAPPLHMYFDMFSGILQAFIFTMLTMVFVSDNIND